LNQAGAEQRNQHKVDAIQASVGEAVAAANHRLAVAEYIPCCCETRAPLSVVRVVRVLRRMGGVPQQREANLRVVYISRQCRCLSGTQVPVSYTHLRAHETD